MSSRHVEQLPDHLVRLPGTEWGLWRWAAVRGAGFASSLPSRLAALDSTALADHLLNDEADQPRRDAFARAFAEETARISETLCNIAAIDRFREAMLWQNRHAVQTALDPLRRHHRARRPRNSQQRQHEELVANYLQRYCLKNETIGFFGPVGWARVSDDTAALTVQPSRRLLRSRTTFFEVWAMEALSAALGQDAELERWLAPRRHHTIHIDGTTVIAGEAAPVTLSATEAALLHACDGEQTVHAIAATLLADETLGWHSEEEILTQVRALRDRGLITLRLDVPMEQDADRALARQLQRIEDEPLRARSLGALQALQRARARVAEAAGDVDALEAAMGDLDSCFRRVTGRAPTRSPGRTYAARTVVYEDCQRDLDVRLGQDFLDAVGPPLALLLASARWLTDDTARRYTGALQDICRELMPGHGDRGGTVALATFLDRALPMMVSERDGHARDAQLEFQARWAQILDLPDGEPCAAYRSASLRPRVDAVFAAAAPGWQYARYHSPDLMLSADSVEHVRRGDYLLVLGELHVGSNTLATPVFLSQHPRAEDLWRAVDRELPQPRLVPVIPKDFWPGQAARLLPALFSSRDIHVALSADPPATREAAVTRPVSDFVVGRDGDHLVVRTRDGAQTFDLVAVMAQALTWQVMSRFSLLPARAHRPRIVIDRLVIARESWSFAPEEIAFAGERNESARFVAARRWVRAHGMPRHVFAKVPREKKPCYVDFASPTYINIFARLIRRSLDRDVPRTARVTVTEMLPRADQAWLTDADGVRYSSELRLVAVDLSLGFAADGLRTPAHA